MKKIFVLFILVIISSCKDPELIPIYTDEEQLIIDNEILENYMKSHKVENFNLVKIESDADISILEELGGKLTKLSSGVFYYEYESGSKDITNDSITYVNVKIYYQAYLTDGTIFDENFPDDLGKDSIPTTLLSISNMIEGLKQGVMLMNIGNINENGKFENPGRAFMFIPSRLAYGIDGDGAGKDPDNNIDYSVPVIYKVELETAVVEQIDDE